MSINGASRVTQAEAELKRNSYSELNSKFANENNTVKSVKKFSMKYPSKHNHSK